MNDKACSECCSTQALNQKPSKAEELNLNLFDLANSLLFRGIMQTKSKDFEN